MALDKVIDSAALDADLLTVANAIRAKGGTSEKLTFPSGFVSALSAISDGECGSGMESGEMTTTSANFYQFTIPVSSKKTHIVVCPKAMDEMISSPTTAKRVYFIYACEGCGILEASLNTYNATSGLNNGASYWYNNSVGSATAFATFDDSSVYVKMAYAALEPGEYCWFAW